MSIFSHCYLFIKIYPWTGEFVDYVGLKDFPAQAV